MTDHVFTTENADHRHLIELGFSESEANLLIYMKDHVNEQIEYREMVEEQHRLNFVRWLIEHDRLGK